MVPCWFRRVSTWRSGRGAYTRPGLAGGLALACLVESALLAVLIRRAQRLMLWPLLADAAFGIAGAGSDVGRDDRDARPGRIAELDAASTRWPPAAGLALLSAFDGEPVPGTRAGRQRWLPLAAAQAVAVLALAAAYLVSVNVPRRLPQDDPLLLWGNAANYVGFFLVAFVLAVLLRAGGSPIARRNDARRARRGRRAEPCGALAGLDRLTCPARCSILSDELAAVGEEVPVPLRTEAGRLIRLIDAVRPDT